MSRAGVRKRELQIRIYDNNTLVRFGFVHELERHLVLCRCVASPLSGSNARGFKKKNPSHLVILDPSQAFDTAITLIRRLRRMHPQTLVLAYTDEESCENPAFVSHVLEEGVCGIVSKRVNVPTILRAIRQILRGESYLPNKVSQDAIVDIFRGSDGNVPTTRKTLTKREIGVYRLMGDGAGPSEIARRLGLSVKTINTHLKNIQSKYGLRSTRELRRHAIQASRLHRIAPPS